MPDPKGWTLVQPAPAAAAAPGWTLVEPATPPVPMFHADNEKDASGNAVVRTAGDFGSGVIESLNPLPLLSSLYHMNVDNLAAAKSEAGQGNYGAAIGRLFHATQFGALADMGSNIGKSHWNQALKSYEAVKKGQWSEAAGHLAGALLPVLGPVAAQIGEQAPERGIANTTGRAVGLIGGIVAPEVAARVPVPRGVPRSVAIVPSLKTANPIEAAAVDFGLQHGIPVDAATATGSPMMRNVQKRLEGTMGGASPIDRARTAQAAALERVGRQQAAAAGPTAGTPVSAGESIQSAVDDAIRGHAAKADAAYGRLRTLLEQRAQPTVTGTPESVTSPIAGPSGEPIVTTKPAPTRDIVAVDLKGFKDAMRPTYEALLRESEIGVPMQGGKGRMFAALDRVMRGPDVGHLAEVDQALGDLKSLARGAEMPELRTQGQGIAAAAVKQLDSRVRMAAAKAGPDVLKALEEGRAATTQKYAVADVRDLLSGEPGQVFRQLTASRDTALNRLKAVQRVASNAVPDVARSFLEDAIDQATAEGGFKHADRLWANWQRLGSDTKRALFPQQGQVQALDNFFLLAKKIGENANPSGTANVAHALNLTQLTAFFPTKALAKVLYSPRSVQMLTDGMRLSLNPAKAAQATAAARILQALQVADAVPMAAGTPSPTQEATDRR